MLAALNSAEAPKKLVRSPSRQTVITEPAVVDRILEHLERRGHGARGLPGG